MSEYNWKDDFHYKVCGGCTLGYVPTDRCISNAPCPRTYCSFKAPTGYCSLSYCELEATERKSILQDLPKQGLQYGWICPKCGAVYSPTVASCWHCTPSQVEITCSY